MYDLVEIDGAGGGDYIDISVGGSLDVLGLGGDAIVNVSRATPP